jgi:endonuclease/exonuclease/phosphatase family metal-dependent hydrolase
MRHSVFFGGALAALCVAGCEPPFTAWHGTEEFPILAKENAQEPAAPSPLALKVMTWNVKFGGARIDFWFDYWGDRTEMTHEEVVHNMEGVYALINEVQPDILLTNEIEIDSRRSAYYDMVKGILEHTGMQWAAYTPVWESRYVPTEGLGRVDMGNCIFSRYRIVDNQRIAQVDRTDQDPVTRSFYLHRGVGRAVLAIGGRELAVYTVHTEAYDQDKTNSRQQRQILDLMREETLPFVLAGDLNALPPTSVQFDHFNDESPKAAGTDYAQPPYNLPDLQPFFDEFVDVIGLARYGTSAAEQSRYYTHSVIGEATIGANGEPGFWNRRLDYMFIAAPDSWSMGDVLQRPGDGGITSKPIDLSDHCPVIGTWEVRP